MKDPGYKLMARFFGGCLWPANLPHLNDSLV
jgi:hypothetical protein